MPVYESDAIKQQLPLEWEGVIPSQVFLDEARCIVAEGAKRDIILRVIGGVAIRMHTMEWQETAHRLGRLGSTSRQEFTDLDFMAYRKQRPRMNDVFDALGYGWRRPTLSTATSERRIYFHPKGWFFVDVFFDELRVANHPLNFKDRFELDSPTLTPTDLLLEKLQIVNLYSKDMKDALVLLLAHKIGDTDAPETINAAYISRLLSKDWGFWYTVTTNLKRIRGITDETNILTNAEVALIDSHVDTLLQHIETHPKTIRWKMRSKIGTRQRWYEPVETSETVGDFGIWRLGEPSKKSK